MPRLTKAIPALLLLTCALCVSEARADTFVITNGYAIVGGFGSGTFSLGGDGMLLHGGLVNGPTPGPLYAAGQSVNLLTRNVGSDILAGEAHVNGVGYSKLYYSGTIDFTAGLPSLTGPLGAFTIAVPFTITGRVQGCLNNANVEGPCHGGYLFDTFLSGQGWAFLELVGFELASGRHFGLSRVVYNFNPNAVVPEPATLALLGTGLAGAAAARRRGRNKAGRSR